MKIKKKNGREVMFNPSKITQRIRREAVNLKVDADRLAISVIGAIADNMTTTELDQLTVEISATKVPSHPDYAALASRIFVKSLRKITPDTFSEAVKELSLKTEMLSDEFIKFVEIYGPKLDKMIVQDRDFTHDIFGLKTLERSYLLRDTKKNIIERPQYMWMRTAIEVTGFNMDSIKETYDAMSEKYGTHATPTLFNAGTGHTQLSSCFLLAMDDDSIGGIYKTLGDSAKISQWAGGIGIHMHDIRAAGSHIKGTNGTSNGIVPMLRVFNDTARYVDQGGGKRKGSFAIYLEPWHADIFDFLELKKNHGKEEMRARDLFYAMWMPDLFMERVRDDGNWTLFCPNEVKKAGMVALQDCVGDGFKRHYEALEAMGLGRKTIKARELWQAIVVAQIETGNPYMAYKDSVNLRSNQQNLGVIKSSNLCIEINEYSDPDEQAVCNLASIAVNMFWNKLTGKMNWVKFKKIVQLFVRNLDNVIDANYYPTPETERSNSKHRPVGLGVQGLADLFAAMRVAFDSPEARKMNKDLFERMYFYALEASNELAQEKGVYSTFSGSPASQGVLQFDMYGEEWDYKDSCIGKDRWEALKDGIQEFGLRNSLLLALMPTASTSQILGNNECFEPFNSNLSTRRTLAGEFVIANKHLISDLEELGLWNESMKNSIMKEKGSILNIPEIPVELKERYKTAYEISMKSIMEMAADRQKFICQAQSMNLFVDEATVSKLSSMHMYSWQLGLKTGMYYLRTKPAVDAIQFTLRNEVEEKPLTPEELREMLKQGQEAEEDEDCLMCGS